MERNLKAFQGKIRGIKLFSKKNLCFPDVARYNDGNNNRDWKCGGTKTRQTPRKHPRMTRHKNQRTNKTPADTDLQSEPSYLGTKMQESYLEQEPLNRRA